jgi:hypothetical protein
VKQVRSKLVGLVGREAAEFLVPTSP